MKVVILSLASRLGDTTGDCVQAEKTTEALRQLGVDVSRCFLNGSRVLDEGGQDCGAWSDVLGDCDIVHAIPPIPWIYLSKQPPIPAKLAVSTVFWRSLAYVRVVHRARGRLSWYLIKEYGRVFLSRLGFPTYRSYQGYDLLLPNSEDEIKNFKSFCRTKSNALFRAVPNAIDPIPDFVESLPRPEVVPTEDYIVVPAVFAARKNHIAFIEATKELSYPIVFMGDGEFFKKCQKIANHKMNFLGYVEHGSFLFYAVLKFARVVCLPSNCETPGIAGLEAAALGARPVVPYEGGTSQYYGWDAEYLNPLDVDSMRSALVRAWERGRLSPQNRLKYRGLTWRRVAEQTIEAYATLVEKR